MNRIGRQLIQNKKQKILAEAAALRKTETGEVYVEKSIVTTRDLLSRLMVANMAQDLPGNQRLSDEDVLARIYISSHSLVLFSLVLFRNSDLPYSWP